MNEGRSYFPSTVTESLVDKMRLNKARPISNYMQNEVIKSTGDVTINNPNQPVGGGLVFSNLQVNGPTRQPPIVQTKSRVMNKYENKRIDAPVNEGLYNWRSNETRSGYKYNHIQEQLEQRAKNKVFNKPMYNYQTQPNRIDSKDKGTANGTYIPYMFDNIQIGGINQSFNNPAIEQVNRTSFKDNFEEGTIRIIEDGDMGFGSLMQQQMKTNPLLHGQFSGNSLLTGLRQSEQGNTPYRIQTDRSINYGTTYPDERMTRYSGERPYTTSGDRQLAARNLATSQANQERRQLQSAAYASLEGIARAPRKNVPNMSQGINDDYQDVSVITNNNSVYNVDRAGRNTDRAGRNTTRQSDTEPMAREKYIARDSLVNRTVLLNPRYGESKLGNTQNELINPIYPQGSFANRSDKIDRLTMVQPQSRVNTQRIIEEVQRNTYENDTKRKIYEDDGPTLFQQSKVDRTRVLEDIDRTNMNDISITERTKQEYDKKPLQLVSKIYEGFKSFFGISPKQREDYERRLQTDDQRISDENAKHRYVANIGTTSGHDAMIHLDKNAKTAYWIVENGRVKNAAEGFKDPNTYKQQILETKPIGILVSEKDIQSIALTKNGDRIKIIQKIVDEDGTKYVSINVDRLEFEKMLDHPIRIIDKNKQQQLASMKNIQEDVCELSFEEYIKVKKIIDELPGIMKLMSDKPLTEFHRELLDENKLPFLTNSRELAEETIMEQEFMNRRTQEGSTIRTDYNTQQTNRLQQSFVGERFYQSSSNNQQVNNGSGIRDQTQPIVPALSKNKSKIMSKFNSMM